MTEFPLRKVPSTCLSPGTGRSCQNALYKQTYQDNIYLLLVFPIHFLVIGPQFTAPHPNLLYLLSTGNLGLTAFQALIFLLKTPVYM